MQAGSRKGWSSQKSDFFCCHGTLVQANAAFNRGLYYQSEDTLYVCQYRDSQVTFNIKDIPVTLLQKQDPLTGSSHLASTSSEKQSVLEDTRKYPSQPDCLVPCLKMETAKAVEMTLQIRIPWWIAGEAQILVNGEEILPKRSAHCTFPTSPVLNKSLSTITNGNGEAGNSPSAPPARNGASVLSRCMMWAMSHTAFISL